MKKISTFVFDLDGTLYEDTHHFRFYADLLKNKLPADVQERFEKDYSLVMEGKHTLKVGRVYDVENDHILSHENGMVEKGWSWEGEEIATRRLKELYHQTIPFDLQTMLSIGDLWWVPVSIARHYGLSSSEAYDAFLQTREHMMTDEFELLPQQEFSLVLEQLSAKYTVLLLTNSPQPDSEIIVKKLGFTAYFHDTIFEANKPMQTADRLTHIANKWNVSFEEILSIGDNYINEILPASNLGCSTIYIDPFETYKNSAATYTVKNMSELASKLKNLYLP